MDVLRHGAIIVAEAVGHPAGGHGGGAWPGGDQKR
jgi:hypothetical protein